MTKANGATLVVPGSHLWGPDRCFKNEEAIPAEMNPGDALILSVTRIMWEVATPQGT
jgi:ectoine hydroxylase-related dioxygenase (phytanoyl-CoA dioxygenase family)